MSQEIVVSKVDQKAQENNGVWNSQNAIGQVLKRVVELGTERMDT